MDYISSIESYLSVIKAISIEDDQYEANVAYVLNEMIPALNSQDDSGLAIQLWKFRWHKDRFSAGKKFIFSSS